MSRERDTWLINIFYTNDQKEDYYKEQQKLREVINLIPIKSEFSLKEKENAS